MKFLLGLVCLSLVATTSANAEGWRPAHRVVRVNHGGVFYNRPVGWGWGGGWRWGATVAGDYMIGLGQLRLQTAQAWLVEAQAAYEWQKVRLLQALVNFQIIELKALQRAKYKLQQQAKNYEEKLTSLNGIVTGHLGSWTFSSIQFFLKQPNIDPTEFVNVRVEPVRADEFFHSYGLKKEIEPFNGGNVLELVEFLRSHSYSVRPGSPAWVELNKIRTMLIEKGEEVLDEVMAQYESVDAGAQDAWAPLSIHSPLVDFEGKDPRVTIK